MLQLVTLRDRPDLRPQIFAAPFRSAWPAFMMHDPVADLYFDEPHFTRYQDTAFAVIDPAQPEIAIGRSFAVPFAFGAADRDTLPDSGWDGVIRWAHQDAAQRRTPNALSALEITLLPEYRGQGGSAIVLRAMALHARTLGYREMVVPVRPTEKHLEPFTPIGEYARRQRPDGLPADPWLRVHLRAGGAIVKVAPVSMVITGTVADWVDWTGIHFNASGPHAVPGALSPLYISLEQDHGAYVEPNVWVRHDLDRFKP